MASQELRAGVIGASGIGKHHAKWLDAMGCHVVFAGTTRASVGETKRALEALFGFSGRGYIGAERMLNREDLDLVVISSPEQLHYEHFMLAAEQGYHILCEKPLVWDENQETDQLIDQGRQMVEAAQQAGIVAAVNLQYAAAVEPYLQLCDQLDYDINRELFADFYMRMDSRGSGEHRTSSQIWIDLGPHPLSVLMAFAGEGQMVEGSERGSIQQSKVEVAFDYQTTQDHSVYARIITCHVPEGKLTRRLGIDNVLVDYEGRDDEDGVYSAYLQIESEELKTTDFVQTSIMRFVNAVRGEGRPLVTIEEGLQNLEMQLRLLEIARA